MAKWWCTELQGRVVDACVQLHGGYGYMTEYPIARAYADARITRIYGGTTEIMKEIIGRSLGRVSRPGDRARQRRARSSRSHDARPSSTALVAAPAPRRDATGWRVRGLDLRSQHGRRSCTSTRRGRSFLGCTLRAGGATTTSRRWRRRRVPRGARTSPSTRTAATLYTADELYAGLRTDGYAGDARRPRLRLVAAAAATDPADVVARALHDAAIDAALDRSSRRRRAGSSASWAATACASGDARLPSGGAARAARWRRTGVRRRHRRGTRGDGGRQPRGHLRRARPTTPSTTRSTCSPPCRRSPPECLRPTECHVSVSGSKHSVARTLDGRGHVVCGA